MGGHFGSNFCGRRPLSDIMSHGPAAKKVAPTEEHYIHKLEDVRSELKAANAEVAELSSKLKDKQSQITSYAKRVSDLERRVRQLGN